MSGAVCDTGGRQSGRTTRQMREAPAGAIFLWGNKHKDYARALARHLGRGDLVIVGPAALADGGRYLITANADLVVDHAAWLLLGWNEVRRLEHVIDHRLRRRGSYDTEARA